MSENAFYAHQGFILHQQHYRESSLIIDVFTQDFGRISLIAKGVRKAKSLTLGQLRPFTELSLSFVGKTNLKTLVAVEQIHSAIALTGMALYCGFYINELICLFLHKDDPHPELYSAYKDCVFDLAKGEGIEVALRLFELNLLENLGYGLQFEYDTATQCCLESDKRYAFDDENGFFASQQGRFSGKTLIALHKKQFYEAKVVNEAKIIMRTVIDRRLEGKIIKSRAVINTLMKQK